MKFSLPQNNGDLIHTRQTLLERLKNLDDNLSWREFFEMYWPLIFNVARKFGLSDVEAQEVVQETVIAVSRNIEKFEYNPERGSFKNWLLKMTRWRILDQVRKRAQHMKTFSRPTSPPDAERRTDTIDRIPDPNGNSMEMVWDEEWKKNLVQLASQRIRKRVDPLHYQIFHLCVEKEVPIARICEMFDVPAGRVYVIKCRISTLIRKEVQILESIPDPAPVSRSTEQGGFESKLKEG